MSLNNLAAIASRSSLLASITFMPGLSLDSWGRAGHEPLEVDAHLKAQQTRL